MSAALPPDELVYQQSHISDDQSPVIIGICSVFTGIALMTLCLRLASRRLANITLGWDDYFACLAAFCLVGLNISACLVAHYGVGKHFIRVAMDPENFTRIGKSEFAFSVFYDWSMTASKLAVLFLLIRVFTLHEPWFKIGAFFWITWTSLWWVASWFVTFLECRPLSTSWGVPYQCRPLFETSVTVAVFNIISDIGILLLPQLLIWRLNIRPAQRLGLSIVFCLGLFATVISIVRIPLTQGANSNAIYDSTWTSVSAVIFTLLEPAVSLICANLPVTPRALTGLSQMSSRMISSLFTSSNKTVLSRDGRSKNGEWVNLNDRETSNGTIKATTTIVVDSRPREEVYGGGAANSRSFV